MNEWFFKGISWLIVVIIILLLSATPIFRGSKEQQSYCKKGMRLLATPRTQVLSLPALGIFLMIFLCSILYLAIVDGAWEEAGGSILLCLAFGLFILIAGFFTAYCMQKRHILYDEEQLLIGRPFRTYRRLTWRELARMEIKSQDAFSLYDRDGVRQISATANLVGYHDFYETAMRHVRPENAVRNGNAGSYQRKYSVTAGEGILRYRTGEYVTMLAVSLMGVAMAIVKGLTSEEGIGAILFSKDELGAKLFIAGLLIISVVCLIYTNLQKITYDRMRITFEHFPKGTESVGWNEVQRIGYSTDHNYRSVTLYTAKKTYVIMEKQFRKGFSKFVAELQKRYGTPQDGDSR
ncbi:MAG: hypothetical protein K2K17_04665 [Lachnospiraceae bacterium]|nr:hypothetical protein [Lachnospiraceae bacterium]